MDGDEKLFYWVSADISFTPFCAFKTSQKRAWSEKMWQVSFPTCMTQGLSILLFEPLIVWDSGGEVSCIIPRKSWLWGAKVPGERERGGALAPINCPIRLSIIRNLVQHSYLWKDCSQSDQPQHLGRYQFQGHKLINENYCREMRQKAWLQRTFPLNCAIV